MKKFYTFIFFLCMASLSFGQILLSEDFEGGLPADWSVETMATDGGWNATTAAAIASEYWAPSTDNATGIMGTNDDECDCDKSADRLISPSIDMSMATNVFMSFDMVFGGFYINPNTETASLEVSTDGGMSWTQVSSITGTGTVDWTSVTYDLSAYAGNADVKVSILYGDAGGWLFGMLVDNIEIAVPNLNDAELTDLTTSEYHITDAMASITGTITNVGGNEITSLDITWSDGTNSYTDNLTGLSIAPLATYDFTHTTEYTVPLGSSTITVDVTNVNAATEGDDSNNMGDTPIQGVPFIPTRALIFEEGTGAGCGWCPRGHVAMAEMEVNYPNTFLGVAVHNTLFGPDGMVNSAYESGYVNNISSSAPSGAAERAINGIDPTQFEAAHNILIDRVAPAELTFSSITYDPSTRELSATISAEFIVSLSGDYRFNLILTENGVTGTTSDFAQVNYYSGGGNGNLSGAGHDWHNEPDPVPAADMVYDHVAREILGGFFGEAGSLPTTINAGDILTHTFTYTIPSAWNPQNMHLIGGLQDMENSNLGEFLNGVGGDMPATVANTEILPENSVKVFPNPASDIAMVRVELEEQSDVTVQVFNNLGQVVLNRNFGQLSGDMILPLNTAEYSNGLYNVHVTVDGKIITKKLMIAK